VKEAGLIEVKMIRKKVCILMAFMLLALSSGGIAAKGEYETANRHIADLTAVTASSAQSPSSLPGSIFAAAESEPLEIVPDDEIDFRFFNEAPHKGNILNGIPYEYIGHTEQRISEIFKTLIGTDFDDSNLESKKQLVNTPQMAAQITAVLNEYHSNNSFWGRFFYAVSLDEENNCWVVEHRFFISLRPNDLSLEFFLVNRNDAKIIVIDYRGSYFRYDKPEQGEVIDEPPGFIFGLSDWAFDEVNSLESRGIIGVSPGFGFQLYALRLEFTDMIINIYEHVMGSVSQYSSPFSDIEDINISDRRSVEKAYAAGLIDGTSANMFTPRGLLTREQAAKILCNLVSKIEGTDTKPIGSPNYSDAAAISDWAVSFVAYAQENKIMLGSSNGQFNPKDNITREEAFVAIERLIVQYGWQ